MNQRFPHLQILSFLLCVAISTLPRAYAASMQQAHLQAGQSFERELKSAETHQYQITLAAGDFLNITVAYRGLIVTVTLNDGHGKPVAEAGGGADTVETAETAIVATEPGTYQLAVSGRGKDTHAGAYTLSVKALRRATEKDRDYAAAQRLILEGNALYNLRTTVARRQALEKFQGALQLWRANHEWRKEIGALDRLCVSHLLLGEPHRAQELAQEMLNNARAHGFSDLELVALFTLGVTQGRLGEYQLARQTQTSALAMSRALKDRATEVEILNSLGFLSANLGEGRVAIGYYQQSLQLARDIGDRNVEASVLNNLAIRYDNIGEPDQSLAFYEAATTLAHQLGKTETEIGLLRNKSTVLLEQGELQQALDLTQQSLTLARAGGSQRMLASTLEMLGQIQSLMGENLSALESLNQAQQIYQAVEEPGDAAISLGKISSVYARTGETDKALDLLQQALSIHRRVNKNENVVADLIDLGVLYRARGELPQSLTTLNETLSLSRERGMAHGEASCLLQLSRTHRALGATGTAKELLQTMLPLTQKIKHRFLEAEAHHDLAWLALQEGHFEEAQTAIEAGLKIIESVRSGLINPGARASYRSDRQSFYEIYTEVLAQRAAQQPQGNFAAQALESVERARARSLLDWLTEGRVDIRRGVDSELLKQEQSLQRRLSAKVEMMQKLGAQPAKRVEVEALQSEIVAVTTELQAVETQIRRASPAYAALTHPQPLKLAEIQQQVLDRDTVLLEYALGTERSYLFAVTPTALKVFTLPKRDDIQNAALGLHKWMSRQHQPATFASLAEKQRWTMLADREIKQAAETLSRMILSPIVAELKGKRLLIVPDGALHYVPFAALPELVASGKPAKNSAPSQQPLVVNHEIIRLPSASTLAVLRRELANRAAAPKTLAVVADPVFSANDERVTRQAAAQPGPPLQAGTGARLFDGFGAAGEMNAIPRLASSRTEAEAILALVPENQRKAAVDFAASESFIQRGELGQYRYLHFATHGFLNAAQPDQSGILLSLIDREGKPQPGLLTTQDVFRLKLPAEMVVLSGCRTGLGKENKGEGLVGMTQGFMYAGARRVLASLWQVNDAATAELMKNFYRGVLGEKKLSPSAALRNAQLEMLKQVQWRSPYFWAAFTLQGEW